MTMYADPALVFLIGMVFGVLGGFALAGLMKGGKDE